MKRLYIFLFILLLPLSLLTAQISQIEYIPFVQKDKRWQMLEFSMGGAYLYTPKVTVFYFDSTGVDKDGKYYLSLYSMTEGQKHLVGLFREENQTVFLYRGPETPEAKVYDFSLQEGDEFTHDIYGYKCKVKRTSTKEYNGHMLKIIDIDATYERGGGRYDNYQMQWIEGVGTMSSPIGSYDDLGNPDSYSHILTYTITEDGSFFIPFPFGQPYNGWRGLQLKAIATNETEEVKEELHYVLKYDPLSDSLTLHVEGYMETPNGPNNYIYCIEDKASRRITFQVERLDMQIEGSSIKKVSFDFPFFSEDVPYTIVDKSGEHLLSAITHHPATSEKANNSISDRKCYDLSGRPLSAPPDKGFFIQDGQKVVR